MMTETGMIDNIDSKTLLAKFEEMDLNKDGKINFSELKTFLLK